MSSCNHIFHQLRQWSEQRDQMQWVLATIIETEGSSYQKAGAMMLINSLGQHLGLLSGGCLESDIMLKARQCWDSGNSKIIEYDMQEEEELAWQLGIGCGGRVKILLQPIEKANHYLGCRDIFDNLSAGKCVFYSQKVAEGKPHGSFMSPDEFALVKNDNKGMEQTLTFAQKIMPPVHLCVFGGGPDARPVVDIAISLGWQVSLFDSRSGYARPSNFKHATAIYRHTLSKSTALPVTQPVDCAVIMHHNVNMDAQALKLLSPLTELKYLGVLGPTHRTDEVLKRAGVTPQSMAVPIASPAGLRLGGSLPESIALSIIAEMHAVVNCANGSSISGVLT